MILTKEQIQKLRNVYWATSNPSYSEGFCEALNSLGVSEEQIEEITTY